MAQIETKELIYKVKIKFTNLEALVKAFIV